MRSNSKHVVLERVRATLNVLRKSNVLNEPLSTEDSVPYMLKELQTLIRQSNNELIELKRTLLPFLRILKARNIAGPYVLVAIESIQAFLGCSVLTGLPHVVSDSLSDIVDVIISCRFVQTDPAGDEVVQLRLVETLRNTIGSSSSPFLSDLATWKIFEFCCKILNKTGGMNGSFLLYQAAERTVQDVVFFVLQRSLSSLNASNNCSTIILSNNSISSSAAATTDVTSVVYAGMPTLRKILAYLIGTVRKGAAAYSMPVTTAKADREGGSGKTSAATARPAQQTQSGGRGGNAPHSAFQALLSEISQDSETLHLLFALKTISAILLAGGDASTMRKLIVSSKELALLIMDDLGFSLLLLCSARDSPYPTSVLQLILGIFGTLLNTLGPCMRILVECFVRQVYLKALAQTHNWFSVRVQRVTEGSGVASPFVRPSPAAGTAAAGGSVELAAVALASGAASSTSFSPSDFRVEELEMIFESLCDILSDATVLPAVFLSFDCSPTSVDILQPLVQFICRCCCLILTYSTELMRGQFKETGVLVIQIFKQIMKGSVARVESHELRKNMPQGVAVAATEGGASSSLEAMATASGASAPDPLDLFQAENAAQLSKVLKASRYAKNLLAEAARLFVEKPEKGLRFLQECGALPKPLTPQAVATFLRVAPDLPKEAVGAFMGELGKENPSYEAGGTQFHTDVLLQYVQSFEFSDHSVLDCMRIFLSAFRLPGEAQQIDRILVAFSEHCHSQSVEGKSGLIENAEITYVLTFSIIMLNTDRHNPNIRSDRRMTIEQFVRNNANYGKDVNQTVPLSKEYLESIFAAIDAFPIRTESNTLSASVTTEVWQDLQMQARVDAKKAILVTTQHDSTFLRAMLRNDGAAATASESAKEEDNSFSSFLRGDGGWNADMPAVDKTDGSKSSSNSGSSSALAQGGPAAHILRRLLAAEQGRASVIHPVELSLELSEMHGICDADLLECVWQDLLRVCVCVHVHNQLVMRSALASELASQQDDDDSNSSQAERGAEKRPPVMLKHAQLHKLLDISNAFLLDLLKISNHHRLDFVLDAVVLILVYSTGMVTGQIPGKLLSFLSWDAVQAKDAEQPKDSSSAETAAPGSSPQDPSTAPECVVVESSVLLRQFRHFESARSSCTALLSVIQQYQSSIANWSTIWYFLGGLRDCALLPKEMVLEAETDLLPPNIRHEFELSLSHLDRKTFDETRPAPPRKVKRQPSSILSLQGLGQALFGGGSSDAEDGDEDEEDGSGGGSGGGDGSEEKPPAVSSEAYHRDSLAFMALFRLDAVSARWDAGYEATANRLKSPLRSRSDPLFSEGATKPAAASEAQSAIPAYSIIDGGMTVEDLRAMVAKSGIPQLVSDTRFLTEEKLEIFLKFLVSAVEVKDDFSLSADLGSWSSASSMLMKDYPHHEPALSSTSSNNSASSPAKRHTWNVTEQSIASTRGLLSSCQRALYSKHGFSSATVAWLEMVLVEVSLRNRDRFTMFWPILKHHYIRVLSGAAVRLSYVTERRVLGLLKICTRMISRDFFSGTILELLGRIFARPTPSPSSKPPPGSSASSNSISSGGGGNNGSGEDMGDEADDAYAYSKPHFSPMPSHLLSQLANQISAAMWRVLTLNVELLPMLPLEQWQTLFTIISISAAASGFAAIKSFEAMAWLLHEPRLIAKVPVFCIIGVKPLLKNSNAPLSVSIGAVHLLTHLHSRLEVLIKDENEDYVDCEVDDSSLDGDTPVLWESCWTPILRALADGISDSRAEVREACAEALCQAILDRHAQAVPAGVLMDILGGIISPMVLQLRDHLVLSINKDLPARARRILTSKEVRAQQQQQWVSVEAPPEGATAPTNGIAAGSTIEAAADALVGAAPLSVLQEMERGPVSVLMECMCALCKSFLQHLKKLSSYPSFDKLWLRILNLLGFFLDCNVHGMEADFAGLLRVWGSLADPTRHNIQDLFAMIATCKDQLQRMLSALVNEGVFRLRPGLLTVTNDTIRHFDGYQEVQVEVSV